MPSGNNGEDWFCIKEVYYDDDGTLSGFTQASLECDTPEELTQSLQRMLQDLEGKPVLHENDFMPPERALADARMDLLKHCIEVELDAEVTADWTPAHYARLAALSQEAWEGVIEACTTDWSALREAAGEVDRPLDDSSIWMPDLDRELGVSREMPQTKRLLIDEIGTIPRVRLEN